ncbi:MULTISPECIES: hypothetical protein [Bacillaceae]|nr:MULTISPECIES: hypothetical protein [Bacillaceae]MED4475432.1 hypothetical protein [Oceanobacillus caeni]
MPKRNFVARNLLKWMPNDEQSMYERKLTDVMKRLKVQDFYFNWDRTSCYVEFDYNENFYKLEHSVEKAKKKGIMLRNGLDCLVELTQSLDDLCGIIDRGMLDFETWISGMKQSPSETTVPEFQEEFEIKYKTVGRQNYTEYNTEELNEPISFGTEPSPNEFEQSPINRRTLSRARF